VYELIQNAEDNRYYNAIDAAEVPSLTFNMHKDRIVVDSNEDGFTQSNIRSICSVGESTKAFMAGYVGEKGIGFKSVFTVTYKVHVQSEPYSFAFHYRKGSNDDELGMTTPFPEAHEIIPNGIKTRITLFLLENLDKTRLFREFQSLPATLLLFLRKLKRLSINLEPENEIPTKISYSLTSNDHRVTISRCIDSTTDSSHFWTVREMVHNLPVDESRKNIREAERLCWLSPWTAKIFP
jgi:hypothetical protein